MNVLKAVDEFLFATVPASFVSAYSLTDSVERLRAATSSSFRALFRPSMMVGNVDEQRVELSRIIRYVGTLSNPHFFGAFRQTESGVVLAGRFAQGTGTKVGTCFILGILMYGTLLTSLDVVFMTDTPWWMPFCPVSLVTIIIVAGRIQRWRLRTKVQWLSRKITRALTSPDNLP